MLKNIQKCDILHSNIDDCRQKLFLITVATRKLNRLVEGEE